MIRSFILLLLFVVVFLAGMLIGTERNTVAKDQPPFFMPTEVHETPPAKQGFQVVQIEHKENIVEDPLETTVSTGHFTQKTATFLEAGVKGFYDLVIGILYQIASLFI